MTAARKPILRTTGHSFPPLQPPRPLSEAQFQKRVIDTAIAHGWRCTHFRKSRAQSGRWQTAVQGHTGAPDLLLAKGGVVILAELKRETGRVSPEQKKWLAELADIGVVWRPSDWDAILARLSGKASA